MTRIVHPFAFLLLVAAMAAASAPVRTIELDARRSVALSTALLVPAGDGYWTRGFGQSPGSYAVHATAAGVQGEPNAVASGFIANGAGNGDIVLVALADGGCLVERRDTTFALRWRRHVDRCTSMPAGDWTWVVGDDRHVMRIDITGAAAEQQIDNFAVAVAGLDNGDLVVVGDVVGPTIVVERLRPDGSMAWRTDLPYEGVVQDAFIATDASALAVAVGGTTSSFVSRLNLATGAREWSTPVAFAHDVALSGSRTWALTSGTNGCAVASFDATTGAARTIETPLAPFRCREADLAALADGSLIVVDGPASVRVAAGAASVAPYSFDGAPGDLVRLRDGSFRVLVSRNSVLGTVAIETDGSWRALTPPPTDVSAAGSVPFAGVSPGGRVLVRAERGRNIEATLYVDGNAIWRVTEPAPRLAAAAFDDVLACDLAIDNGTATPVRLTCRNTSDGNVRFTQSFEAPGGAQYPRLSLANDSSVVATWTDSLNRTTSVRRFGRDGTLDGQYGTNDQVVAINALAHVLVSRQASDNVAVLGDSGQVLSVAGERLPQIVVPVPDFDALLTVDRNVLRQYSTTGALLSQAAVNQDAFLKVVASFGGAIVVESPTSGAQLDRIVRYIDRATGSVRWERRIAGLGANIGAAVGGDTVAFVGQTTSWSVNRVALLLTDGRTLLRDEVPCSPCAVPSVGLDGGGVLHTFTQSTSDGHARVYVDTLPETPRGLDARNASGAWYYAPLPGDGFVASVDATSGAFFAAWFTYSGQPAPGPAGQHWYTLQGDVVAGEAVVSIYDTTGGVFDAAAPVTTSQVGTARLRLVGCERIELEYTFANGLGNGRRTMTRLTDPAHDCAGVLPPAANGLDWRQSGAWFDPAKSGQGVLFSIDPSGPSFGAWFTYDAAGAPDDAAQQQWLTLQSTEEPAIAGHRALTIFRTTDGRFGLRAGAYSTRVGAATVRFDGCTRAAMDYTFDETLAAGNMSGQRGTLSLQRIGACP